MTPITGNPNIDQWISILGTLVPAASAIAGILNQRIRTTQGVGDPLNPYLLSVVAVLNVFAVNFDKAMQLAKLASDLRSARESKDSAVVDVTPPNEKT